MGVDMATSGRGAPQLGDMRLRQDRGERGGALDSDVVPVETVRARVGAGMANEYKRDKGR